MLQKNRCALRKVERTPQHTRNVNTLQKKATKATNKITQLIESLNSPLADVQEQNQSYSNNTR